jgi:hypothetical protein
VGNPIPRDRLRGRHFALAPALDNPRANWHGLCQFEQFGPCGYDLRACLLVLCICPAGWKAEIGLIQFGKPLVDATCSQESIGAGHFAEATCLLDFSL